MGHILSKKKNMKISKNYFGPGSPKNWFLRFFRKKFTKKWAGIRNHEWDDGHPGTTSETTGALGASSVTTGAQGGQPGTGFGSARSEKLGGQPETLYVARAKEPRSLNTEPQRERLNVECWMLNVGWMRLPSRLTRDSRVSVVSLEIPGIVVLLVISIPGRKSFFLS